MMNMSMTNNVRINVEIPVILPKVQAAVTAKHAYTLRMWLCMK